MNMSNIEYVAVERLINRLEDLPQQEKTQDRDTVLFTISYLQMKLDDENTRRKLFVAEGMKP